MPKKIEPILPTLALLLLIFCPGISAAGDGPAPFNYQGYLEKDDKAITGTFDFQVLLFAGPTSQSEFLEFNSRPNIEVYEGIFLVELDFGAQYFDGRELWIQTCIEESNGSGGLMCFTPLQQLLPTPYSTFALDAFTLQGHQPTDFVPRTTGCQICLGHADRSEPEPSGQICFDLSSDGRDDSNFLQLDGDVDDNDRLWLWMECP